MLMNATPLHALNLLTVLTLQAHTIVFVRKVSEKMVLLVLVGYFYVDTPLSAFQLIRNAV